MGIFLRQSHNVKPSRWGSFADVQYATRVNSEKIYGCDPDDDVLVMPLFWGLPCWDYSGYNNHGTNYGATYKDGSLDFDGTADRITGDGTGIGTIGIGNYTVSGWVYKKDSEAAGIVAFGGFNPAWAIDTNEHIYIFDSFSKPVSTGVISLNSWQYITFVRSGTGGNELVYYINGGVDSNTTHSDSIPAVTTFVIGTDRINGSVFDFNGVIDEVRIAKAARTADQIALFNDNKYGLYQKVGRPIWSIPAAPPVGAIMNQFQGANLGADLFNGTLL